MDARGLSTFEFTSFAVGPALVLFEQAGFDLIRGCNTFVERIRFFRSFVLHIGCVSSRSVCVSASWVGEGTYNVEKKTSLIG